LYSFFDFCFNRLHLYIAGGGGREQKFSNVFLRSHFAEKHCIHAAEPEPGFAEQKILFFLFLGRSCGDISLDGERGRVA